MIEDRSKNLLIILLIVVVAFAVYCNTFRNPFVYDDRILIENNRALDDPRNLKDLFNDRYFLISGERSWRPAATALFFIEAAIGGRKPLVFRIASVLLHTANGILVFLILFALTGRRPLSVFSALLFLLHPMQTEAVNGISFVEDPLAAFFFFAAFYFWLKSAAGRRSAVFYILSLVFFLLSVFSKENAALLPFVIMLAEWVFRRGESSERPARLNVYSLAGYFAVVFVFFIARFIVMVNPVPGAAAGYPGGDPIHAVPIMASAFLRYIKLFFFPFGLSLEHCFSGTIPLFAGAAIISFALHALILVFGLMFRRVNAAASFGALFYLLNLVPISNIAPFGAVMAERYFYLPAFGLCVFVTGMFFAPTNENQKWKSVTRYGTVILICWLVALGFLTVRRNRTWNSELYLWKSALDVCPDSSRAQTGYGYRLLEAAEDQAAVREAVGHLEQAVRLDPQHYEALLALGTAYWRYGKLNKALYSYLTAYEIHPTNDVRYDTGLLYSRAGKQEKALPFLLEIMRTEPDWIAARYLLGNVYLKMSDVKNAEKQYRYILKIDPGNIGAENNLGAAYIDSGDYDAAERTFKNILAKHPGNEYALRNLDRIRKLRKSPARP